jgi:hypothetical protein
MNDILIDKINFAIKNNFELILDYSFNLDYNNQKIIWNNQKYYIKNIKIDHILKEIREFISNNKKAFIKLSLNNLDKNIDWIFVNTPWEVIEINNILD